MCKLVGELDILIGLLAFLTVPALAHVAVDQSFLPNNGSTAFVNPSLSAPDSTYRVETIPVPQICGMWLSY
jgi:hypothetical protein